MITISSSGSFKNTDRFLKKLSDSSIFSQLDSLAREGVSALANATPSATGATAAGWNYEVRKSGGSYSIIWYNTHMVNGQNIAVLLQYGHGTGTGGYVAGRDYINPVMRPLFDKIADRAWKVVTSA